MSVTSAPTPPAEPQSRALRTAFRGFAAIEKVGNKLPHPFWLFWILAGVVAVLSAVLAWAGVSAEHPGTHKTITVESLLSKDGLTMAVEGAVDNFAAFPPLATILTVMFGIVVAEKSGLFSALLRRMVARVPGKYLTFALSMTAMVSHVAGDAAYFTLIPIGALIFRAAGRSPVLGCIVAYVSISAGYNASPSLTTTDVLLSSITTAAAHTIDAEYVVTPVSNYFFGVGSSVLVALVITLVVDKVLVRRADLEPDEPISAPDAAEREAIEVTEEQSRALRVTGLCALGFVGFLVAAMVPASSPLRGEGGGIVNSPLIGGMALVLGLFFAVLGTVYGRVSGTFSAPRDIIDAMVDGTRSMAPILVLFFAISQFLAYFKWTNIGDILAVKGAETLRALDMEGWTVLVGIAVLITFMNLVITSGSALWALAAPVLVPMLMLIGIEPETTQAVYRVADSVTNCVTPMSPYFVMALGFIQQYRKSAGIGTLASFTIPIAAVVWVAWMAFFVVWYLLGIPFGIN
ncbi:AbgT family transporter [Streptomyces clavuligerus]|uniref:Putative aminobenzoyl-glutamate transporter n=1 Tax=Streptomyces clavuligerus TaxID=1901 RepID=E2Q8B4_STRCL|nr:AbgT family transporter [Streptomyces clavuligerus]ANW21407.1 p-aminobenzoyl-glutamate transporter [Streptomyces clavuligerus]AXU16039.1 AbgT family transporter [Streptomyces clavuligerus]EFG05446.1 putative aminobenzoyl-glutamate transporter [Streptomyces clavuligerus]MBY6306174.1 AbgT family transporter [Streptomyces clavuligerus]QCS08817.1 p-aminobenzoyl-glutamate transporter [Streptomyces clavuligerus]